MGKTPWNNPPRRMGVRPFTHCISSPLTEGGPRACAHKLSCLSLSLSLSHTHTHRHTHTHTLLTSCAAIDPSKLPWCLEKKKKERKRLMVWVGGCQTTGKVKVLVAQLCLTLCNPMDCSLPGFSVHGDSPGKNTGVGCQALLQGISLQGSNPHLLRLLHCRKILYH